MNFLKLKTTTFGCFIAIITLSIFLTSCEKTSDVIETTTVQKEEGYKSTTNNETPIFIDEKAEVLQPVMRMNFTADANEAETDVKWNEAVEAYIAELEAEKNKSGKVGVSTELFFSLRTKTGPQSYNGTDGTVYGRMNFASSVGNKTTKWYKLDNFGNDREEGDWDYYLLRAPITGSSTSYARARWAQLALKGTDGWFPTDFDIHIYPSYQTVPATGSSHIYSSPNVWLDSSSSNGWDYYSTGVVGYGTLNF